MDTEKKNPYLFDAHHSKIKSRDGRKIYFPIVKYSAGSDMVAHGAFKTATEARIHAAKVIIRWRKLWDQRIERIMRETTVKETA